MINWSKIRNFSKDENWSEDPDKFAEPKLIETLDRFRDELGCPIRVSGASGALARTTGGVGSRHYIGKSFDRPERLSDAIDVFPDCDIKYAFAKALSTRLFTGIGVYFDTHYVNKPAFMMHLDLRPGKFTLWFRDGEDYQYPLRDMETRKEFYRLLNEYGE